MKNHPIIVVDSGCGNPASVRNMIFHIGYQAIVTDNLELIGKAKKIILPGVGSFDTGMRKLDKKGLINVLNDKVIKEKTPVLGICLGMQLMTLRSEEGQLPGLGWIRAETIKFKNQGLVLPHMGWNTVKSVHNNTLFSNFPYKELAFYFIHSFHVLCENVEDVAGVTFYGYEFTSSFEHDNIYGVQFHPEKSHKYGMEVLRNFIEKG